MKIYRYLYTNTTQVIVHHNYCRGTKIYEYPNSNWEPLVNRKSIIKVVREIVTKEVKNEKLKMDDRNGDFSWDLVCFTANLIQFFAL